MHARGLIPVPGLGVLGRLAHADEPEGHHVLRRADHLRHAAHHALVGVNAAPHGAQPHGRRRQPDAHGHGAAVLREKSGADFLTSRQGANDNHGAGLRGHAGVFPAGRNARKLLLVAHHHKLPRPAVAGRGGGHGGLHQVPHLPVGQGLAGVAAHAAPGSNGLVQCHDSISFLPLVRRQCKSTAHKALFSNISHAPPDCKGAHRPCGRSPLRGAPRFRRPPARGAFWRRAQNRRQRPPPPPCQSESRAPAPHRPRLQSCPKRERPRRQSCRPGPS